MVALPLHHPKNKLVDQNGEQLVKNMFEFLALFIFRN